MSDTIWGSVHATSYEIMAAVRVYVPQGESMGEVDDLRMAHQAFTKALNDIADRLSLLASAGVVSMAAEASMVTAGGVPDRPQV